MNDHLGGCIINNTNGDTGTYAPQVWDYLILTYKPKKVLDIGCGAGYSLKYFLDKHLDGIGIEGYEDAIRKSPVRGNIVKHDFTNSPFVINTIFDLGWCCEFVEHIEEKYIDNFMQAFKQCKYLAMTHAVPGQPGHHHVNCQNSFYWIDKLKNIGFIYLESESLKMRDLLKSVENGSHVKNTLMLFKNTNLDYSDANISIETHPELYKSENIKYALDYAKKLKNKNISEKVNFHFYWRVPLDFGRKQLLPILSAINTQDLSNVNINLWSNIDLSNNKYLKDILPYINLKIFNIQNEVNGTILDKCKFINSDDSKCWLGGDLFRLLILHKYGGFYLDMDVVCLRDMNPILGDEFFYQWGSSGTTSSESHLRANGAIMSLKQNSELSLALLRELMQTKPDPNSTCWGTDLYLKVYKKIKFNILPCAWFNTEWGPGICVEPFKKNPGSYQSSELYDGAFTWHWHNKWTDEIEVGSKFEILETLNKENFIKKFGKA